MPISDEALQNPKNRFIAVTADAKLGQAIAALQQSVDDGQAWWHLIVQRDDGSWGAARFNELGRLLGEAANAADIRLGDADALRAAATIERTTVETKAARTLARKSPANVLVVTDNGIPVGILVEGTTRAAATPAPGSGGLVAPSVSLNELGGKYIKLKDYGSILLSSSKK